MAIQSALIRSGTLLRTVDGSIVVFDARRSSRLASGRESTMKSGVLRCRYCDRILVTENQISFKFCSSRCRDRNSGDIPKKKIISECLVLMNQYERGGWKGY